MRLVGFLAFLIFLQAQSLQEVINHSIANNAKIKVLELEISKLENQAKIARRWENPALNFGFNAMYLENPTYRGDPMQSISFSVSQKMDLFAKKPLEGEKFSIQKKIKLLELKALKKELIKQIKVSMIKNYQDIYKYELLNSTLHNLEILKNQLNSSSTQTMTTQVYKIEILQTRLKIRLQQILENKKNELINLNEVSFGTFEDIPFQEDFAKDFEKDFYKKSFELQIIALQKELDQKDISLAKRSFLSDPTLNIGYFYRQNRTDYLSFSLAFSLPVYGKESLALENARKQTMITQEKLLDRENAIKSRINRLLNTIKNRKEELAMIEKNLIPQSQKLVSLLRKNLSSNLSTMSDYHNAINDLLENKILRIETLGSIWIALSELESIGD